MAICTFFGHSDCSDNILNKVQETITDLYKNHNVTEYYVGNNGNFDSIVTKALREIRKNYPNIKFSVVLAYYPKEYIPDSIYPEGLEKVPKKFCIDKRNRWMIKKSRLCNNLHKKKYRRSNKIC